jgi:hypothetical protein
MLLDRVAIWFEFEPDLIPPLLEWFDMTFLPSFAAPSPPIWLSKNSS